MNNTGNIDLQTLRLLRVFRILRILNRWASMQRLITALAGSLRSILTVDSDDYMLFWMPDCYCPPYCIAVSTSRPPTSRIPPLIRLPPVDPIYSLCCCPLTGRVSSAVTHSSSCGHRHLRHYRSESVREGRSRALQKLCSQRVHPSRHRNRSFIRPCKPETNVAE